MKVIIGISLTVILFVLGTVSLVMGLLTYQWTAAVLGLALLAGGTSLWLIVGFFKEVKHVRAAINRLALQNERQSEATHVGSPLATNDDDPAGAELRRGDPANVGAYRPGGEGARP